jgi:hypothetical protein
VCTALIVCLPAWAKPGAGTLADPVVVDALPYAIKGDTSSGRHDLDSYSCATQSQAGPERVYRFTLTAPARVSAWIEAASPVDVQILDDATVSGSSASNCAAFGDVIAEAQLGAGDHYVILDSASDATAGAFVLHLDAVGDTWISRTLANGVTWRARRFSAMAGGAQVVNQLVIDLDNVKIDLDGVKIRALAASGCQTVADLGQAAGAIAGVNGGFFGAGCAPTSLLKASGVVSGTNASLRGTFGMTPSPSPAPLVGLIGAGADWPAALEAHGGGPILAQLGAPHSGLAAWLLEGFTSAAFLNPNARTVAGFDSTHIHFATVDGGRATAAGMAMDALAGFVTSSEIGLSDAVNLQGDAASTMWIAGATPNGVVNYPSTEDATHPGAMGVSGGWFLFAPPYDHPPRFQTLPPGNAAVGSLYQYDADAIDLDVDDVLTYRLDSPPAGASVDPVDGTVQLTAGSPGSIGLTLVVSDGRGGEARQSWLVSVTGGSDDAGVENDGGVADLDGLSSSAASGCSLSPRAPSGCLWLLFLLCLSRRSRHA